jgi:hypothetical protein
LGVRLRSNAGTVADDSPTLDRLIPKRGYARGNIAVISMKANRAKSNCTAAQIELLAAWMRRNGLA